MVCVLEGFATYVGACVVYSSDPQTAGEMFDADLEVERCLETGGAKGSAVDAGAGGAVHSLLPKGVTGAVAANVAV